MQDLGGKIAFVTGGGSGIGPGLVKALAAAGSVLEGIRHNRAVLAARAAALLGSICAEPLNEARANSARGLRSNPVYESQA